MNLAVKSSEVKISSMANVPSEFFFNFSFSRKKGNLETKEQRQTKIRTRQHFSGWLVISHWLSFHSSEFTKLNWIKVIFIKLSQSLVQPGYGILKAFRWIRKTAPNWQVTYLADSSPFVLILFVQLQNGSKIECKLRWSSYVISWM